MLLALYVFWATYVHVMKNSIAHRRLLISKKGVEKRTDLYIHIGPPRFMPPEKLPFEADDKFAVCNIEMIGFEEPFFDSIYGADLIQAIQLASNIDPILRSYSVTYDLFFEDGEPYFED